MIQMEEISTIRPPISTTIEPLAFRPTLVGRLRSLWHSVAGRWAVQHVIEQQSRVNRFLWQTAADTLVWLTEQDQALASSNRQLSEMKTQLANYRKHIDVLEARLAVLEAAQSDSC